MYLLEVASRSLYHDVQPAFVTSLQLLEGGEEKKTLQQTAAFLLQNKTLLTFLTTRRKTSRIMRLNEEINSGVNWQVLFNEDTLTFYRAQVKVIQYMVAEFNVAASVSGSWWCCACWLTVALFGLQGHLNRTETSMVLVTPVLYDMSKCCCDKQSVSLTITFCYGAQYFKINALLGEKFKGK